MYGGKGRHVMLPKLYNIAHLQAHLCITMHNQATGESVSAEWDLSPLLIFNSFLRMGLKKWPRATPKGQKKPCITTTQNQYILSMNDCEELTASSAAPPPSSPAPPLCPSAFIWEQTCGAAKCVTRAKRTHLTFVLGASQLDRTSF